MSIDADFERFRLENQHVPERCRRVYELLLERRGRWLRIKDILDATGHPCDERKLRELREINPGLVESRWQTREGRGWNEYRMAGTTTFPQGVLFGNDGR